MSKDFFMNINEIEKYLNDLNEEMKKKNIYGEVSLVGGAVMCLCYKSREVTRDIDAIYEPKTMINECIQNTAKNMDIPEDWLNDSVKGFLSEKAEFKEYLKLSNLIINVAKPEYMLAMKCLSSRAENKNEVEDIKHLIKILNIKTYEEVEQIIFKYYSPDSFLIKTKYLIMEVLGNVYS